MRRYETRGAATSFFPSADAWLLLPQRTSSLFCILLLHSRVSMLNFSPEFPLRLTVFLVFLTSKHLVFLNDKMVRCIRNLLIQEERRSVLISFQTIWDPRRLTAPQASMACLTFCVVFIVCSLSLIVCVALCAVFCSSVVCYIMWYVYFYVLLYCSATATG
jgi:hypothetical protein